MNWRACPPYHCAAGGPFRDSGADGRSDDRGHPADEQAYGKIREWRADRPSRHCSRKLARARGFYEALGLRVTHEETVEHEGVRVAMIPLGESRVELLEPLSPETTVGRFLSKRGAGLHHVALRVDDIDAAWAELQARGVASSLPPSRPEPAVTCTSSCTPKAPAACCSKSARTRSDVRASPTAFDTCGEVGTVALVDLKHGATTVTCISQAELPGRTASARLMPAVDEMLRRPPLICAGCGHSSWSMVREALREYVSG